ncbi:BTAD domain-containing putative transcriptional regulator, partial [Calidithermus chliarophilus]|uniref:BTAD domain-containing putative transcriptional regulator n=1 Tax=Calidithermus chliarophilus TaxID=52023 RepID=UPI000687F762
MTPWQLRVLGTPHLHRAGQPPVPLERKPAALLAYLALEGPTPRSRLAGLLWPEGSDASARNNLRQTLFNLRRFEGLFSGSDPLGLGPGVESDVAELQSQVTSGQGQGLEWQGQLLEGYDYDDCPEFEEWLLHERERLRELRREALGLLCERLEREGKLAEALSWAQKLLEADPISEASHRRVMRLHYLLGDRAAALRAYQRCAEVLQRELGVRPLEETVALAEEIGRGALPVLPPAQHKPIPLALQRPPVLAGREREWALMEEAWEAGRVIYVVGEPGIGKTRLVQDFAASKGGGLYLPARPGFREIPFAAAVSLARARLAAAPEVVLPPWVRLELARILPELREEGEPPAQGEGERLRFYQAYLELVRLTGARFAASISDDVQYYDQATIELGAYLISQRAAYGLNRDIPRYVMTYRPGELTPQAQATVDELVASGLAARVELRPLEPAAVAVLLDGLRL